MFTESTNKSDHRELYQQEDLPKGRIERCSTNERLRKKVVFKELAAFL